MAKKYANIFLWFFISHCYVSDDFPNKTSFLRHSAVLTIDLAGKLSSVRSRWCRTELALRDTICFSFWSLKHTWNRRIKIFKWSSIVTSPMRSELTWTSKCRTWQNKGSLFTNSPHRSIKLSSRWLFLPEILQRWILTYLTLVIQNNHTYYVNYNVGINIVEQMDIRF